MMTEYEKDWFQSDTNKDTIGQVDAWDNALTVVLIAGIIAICIIAVSIIAG